MPLHPDEVDRPGSEPTNESGVVTPARDVDTVRLRDAMNWSLKKLKPFQERYFEAIKFFAGSRYGENNDCQKTPMNLLRLAVEIWLRQLAAQTPRALVVTPVPDLKTAAFELEIATDFLLNEIGFGDSMSEVVRTALFGMGIMKIGITEPYLAEGSAFSKSVGQPYADPVLFEDWIHDMQARRPDEWDWCGNKYRLPLEAVMENKDFNKKVRDMLKPQSTAGGPEDLTGVTVKSNRLSVSETSVTESYRDWVDIYDIWLPAEGLIVTMPVQDGLDPLMVREWNGPKHGPYHMLGFTKVPGNLVTTGPVQGVYDVQDVITRLFNHMTDQALRQKTVTIADGRAVEDGTAERIMESVDGQVIRTSHIEGVREMKYGGVDPGVQAYTVWLREIFSYLGGNIDAMGGLAQQAGTLGQEQLLVSSSSEMIRDLQSKVVDFTKRTVKDLAWYMYSDPHIELPLTKKIEGYGEVDFNWTPSDREADFFKYHFDIQPYSLQNKGPAQRLQTIMSLTQGLLLPLAGQMQMWGMQLNIQKLIEIIGKYADLPELSDLITTEIPTSYEQMYNTNEGVGVTNKPAKPPVTQRNYTRSNVQSGGTMQNQDRQLMQSLMSAAGKGGGNA